MEQTDVKLGSMGRYKARMCPEPTLDVSLGLWARLNRVWAVAHFHHVCCAAPRAKIKKIQKAFKSCAFD